MGIIVTIIVITVMGIAIIVPFSNYSIRTGIIVHYMVGEGYFRGYATNYPPVIKHS